MMRGHFDERLIGHAQRRRQNARLVVTFIIPRWQQQQKQQPQSRLFAVEIVRRRRRGVRAMEAAAATACTKFLDCFAVIQAVYSD